MTELNAKTILRTNLKAKRRLASTVHTRRKLFLESLEQRQLMAIDVGVIGGSGGTSGFAAIVNQLNDDTYFDFNATLLTEAQADTAGELSAFDVVVVGNSGSGGVNYSAFESALRSYVEGGGGLVSTGWVIDWTSELSNSDLAAVVPVNLDSTRFSSPGAVNITNGSHPVTNGVTDFTTTSFIEGSIVGADAGSTALATTAYTSPDAVVSPSVVVADIAAGRSVYLGPIYSGNTSYGNADLRSGMADRLLEQSAAWAAGATTAGTVSATLVGGDLTVTDSADVANDVTLSNDGAGNIVITDANEAFASTGGIAGAVLSNSNKTLTVPIASITGAQIILNTLGGSDTVTANLANALGKILSFNGGDPTTGPGDKLIVSGGTHTTATLNHTNNSDGSVVLGASTINYTGLEPVDITGTTITNLVINLPDTDDATDDDTKLSISAGNLIVDSLNGEHEDDSISLTGITSITVNGREGSDSITLDKTLKDFVGAIAINGGNDGDTLTVDLSDGDFAATITYTGGSGSDKLTISGGTLATAALTFPNATDVSLSLDLSSVLPIDVEQISLTATTIANLAINLPDIDDADDDDTKFSLVGTDLVIDSQNSEHVDSIISLSGVASLTVNGRAGDDEITLDSSLAAFAGGITVNGGAQSDLFNIDHGVADFAGGITINGDTQSVGTGDKLVISGGTHTLATVTHTNANDGSITLDATAIVYTGLEPIDITGSTITNLVINLPDTDDAADDDTRLSIVAGSLFVDAQTGEHEDDLIFLAPTTASITVNARAGDDIIRLDSSLSAFAGTLAVNGGANSDELDLSLLADSDVVLTDESGTGFKGNVTGTLTLGFDEVETATASTAGSLDSLTGLDKDSTWTVNDTTGNKYKFNNTLSFSGFDDLQGGLDVDTFNVEDNSSFSYKLSGNGGSDLFNFGNAGSLDKITKAITVTGGAGNNDLTLNDATDADDNNYTIDGSKVGRTASGTITYATVRDLTINAGNGKNKLTIENVPTASGTTTFNAAGNSDTLDLSKLTNSTATLTAANAGGGFDGSATGLTSFTSVETITFKGAASTDTLTGIDKAATWTVNDVAGSKYVADGKTLSFSGADNLTGGALVDTFDVQNNSATTNYTLSGQAGLDLFNFGLSDSLDGITNNVTVLGGADSGNLTLNDAKDADPNNYTLNDDKVGRTTGGTITYSSITDLTINAGEGNNKFTVTKAPAATGNKVINGNKGNDSLDLTALTGVTVNLTGKNAKGGFDGSVDSTITLFTTINSATAKSSTGDTLNNKTGLDANWTINEPTSNTLVADSESFSFDDFETLNGDAGKDTYLVRVNSPANQYILNGKDGNDTFRIGDTSNKLTGLAKLSIDGGSKAGDLDEIRLLDSAETVSKSYEITPTAIKFQGATLLEPSGSSFNVESIRLEAGSNTNTLTVQDGLFADNDGTVASEPTNVTLVHAVNGKLSTLAITDPVDSVSNTWSIASTKTVRSVPAAALTVDYAATALSNYSLSAGSGGDSISINSTAAATIVNANGGSDTINVNAISHTTVANGNDDNDTVNVATGDLDVIGAALMVTGGNHDTTLDRTVFSGGTKNATVGTFTPTSLSTVDRGDTLNIQDQSQTSTTFYNITGAKVTRTGAANAVNYGTFELLNLRAGIDDSDIIITMNALPSVVTVDGGGAGKDNRLQIKGSVAADNMTVGDLSADESNRSQFEVTSINRMWLEGGAGSDVLHNRTAAVPALMDGGNTKTTAATTATVAAPQADTIVSDAKSNATFSPVLLGNDGADYLHTTNPNALTNALPQDKGTTYLVGDYFINPSQSFRLQAVKLGAQFGEAGDVYTTADTAPGDNNHVLARRDTAANSYHGNFVNLTADAIGNNLTVIDWLRGRLGLTITNAGIAGRLAEINFHVRQFVRTPGTAAVPPAGSQTYRPLNNSSANPANWSPNGGEFTGDAAPEVVSVAMTNPFEAGDVNGDGRITAFDALAIINELNLRGAHQLDQASDGAFGMDGGLDDRAAIDFLDVNGDRSVSAMDALVVINKLNTGNTTYEIPEFNPFAEIDAWEAADSGADDVDTSVGQADSVTDEALLALIALDRSIRGVSAD